VERDGVDLAPFSPPTVYFDNQNKNPQVKPITEERRAKTMSVVDDDFLVVQRIGG
jgi:hypothetical protein